MVDGSWDGGGAPAPKGMGGWAKAALGCGAALVVGMGTCAGGCIYLGSRIEKDPAKFERSFMGFVGRFIQEDWEDLRQLVDRLGTDAGSLELYRAAPGLKGDFPTEEDFLAAARKWRPLLEPLPRELADLDARDLTYNSQLGGKAVLGMRLKNGTMVRITWDGKRRKDIPRATQLAGLDIGP